MNRPEFIPAKTVEAIRLTDPRSNWRGRHCAEVELGQYADGSWTYAISASTETFGFAGPLGHWTDATSILAFDSRDAALEAAVSDLLDRMTTSQDRVGVVVDHIVTWAKGLLTFQGDLFAFAA